MNNKLNQMLIRNLVIMLTLPLLFFSCTEGGVKSDPEINKKFSNESISSLIVSKDGQIIIEEYFNGATRETLLPIKGISTFLLSNLAGVAVNEELMVGENDPLSKSFPSYFKGNRDPRKLLLSMKHLMGSTTGLRWLDAAKEEWPLADHSARYVLDMPMVNLPGLEYKAHPGTDHLLSVALSNITGKPVLEFANEKLFTPLNINGVSWNQLKDGNYDGRGKELKMKTADVVKLGQLVLDNGQWKERQLLPAEWTQKMLDPSIKKPVSESQGLPNASYGFGWYLATLQEQPIHYAMGEGGQFLIVLPEKNGVIVALHDPESKASEEIVADFLTNKLPTLIGDYLQAEQ